MTAIEVIREIEALPPAGQAEVIRFTQQLKERRQLSGDELTQLAKQMKATDDPVSKEVLKEAIVRGFYGEGKDAQNSAGGPSAGANAPSRRASG